MNGVFGVILYNFVQDFYLRLDLLDYLLGQEDFRMKIFKVFEV